MQVNTKRTSSSQSIYSRIGEKGLEVAQKLSDLFGSISQNIEKANTSTMSSIKSTLQEILGSKKDGGQEKPLPGNMPTFSSSTISSLFRTSAPTVIVAIPTSVMLEKLDIPKGLGTELTSFISPPSKLI